MRSPVIMLLGVLLAIGIDTVWLWPESPTPTAVYTNLPSLAAIGLGTYALFSLLAPAALMIMDLGRVRTRLKSLLSLNRRAWDAAFTGTSLTRIGARLVEFAQDGNADLENQVLVRCRLGAAESRREIGWLYWNWLARLQCLTAIAVLVALLGFNLAQFYAFAPGSGSAAFSQLLLFEVLAIVLLGFLSRAAINLAAERFLDTVGDVPFEYLDTILLHSLGSGSGGVPAPITNLLATLLERDQQTLSEAISRLAESSELLSSIAQAGARANIPIEPPNLDEFTSAIDRLAASIERVASLSLPAASRPVELAPERPPQQGELSRDLRTILKEFD